MPRKSVRSPCRRCSHPGASAQHADGQVEVLEAELALAGHEAKTGGKDGISGIWSGADLKAVSTGKRIDVLLEGARLGMAWNNFDQVRTGLQDAAKLLMSGGDWDRRNRLKIYTGLQAMVGRDFKKASTEFLSGLATFTSDELFSYDRFASYAILTSMVALDRVDLKSKVIDSAEVVALLDGAKPGSVLALAGRLLAALYDCRYRDFMVELLAINDLLLADRYFHRHARWFLREMRVKAYAQFLTSYKSVKLAWMAESFGVSVQFMDNELAQFIVLNRFSAKMDKVAGIVETNRPDTSNAKFHQVIKHGDALLNRVQKLARAVDAA
jgi:26S proteasome regulatory subunit N7